MDPGTYKVTVMVGATMQKSAGLAGSGKLIATPIGIGKKEELTLAEEKKTQWKPFEPEGGCPKDLNDPKNTTYAYSTSKEITFTVVVKSKITTFTPIFMVQPIVAFGAGKGKWMSITSTVNVLSVDKTKDE